MARTTATVSFQALELKGSLLPASLLEEISKLARPKELLLEPKDYGLGKGEGLRERIDAAWVLTKELWEEYTDLSHRAGKSIAGQHFGTRLLKEVFGWNGAQACNGWQQGESHYPINARAFDGAVPVILRGLDADDLDRGSAQFGQEGRKRSPHSCLQECLNADDNANWGVLLSGDRLRLLHDNPSLVKPAYLAADLELLIEGELHAEFAVLWLLLHTSRFQHPQTGSCVLDGWKQQAEASGERVLGALRGGVQSALESLGWGFLNHPSNGELREALQSGQLSRQQFHEQLLRLVYRFLFLFTTEDRNLLFPRDVDKTDARRRIYQEGYSVTRLRELAIKSSAYEGDYGDLWELQRLVFQQLSIGNSPLGLPGLGGLFSLEQCPDLQAAELWNGPLLRAIKAIGWFDADGSFTRVRYRDLNTEELGSVYEGLLELHPQLEQQGSQWQLSYGGGAGSDRKTTGSYYTPDALVQELIKSALIPVIDDRLSKAHGQAEQEQALLKIKVIDPACGSGHFLLAAGRRLAVALAQVRAGDDQPSEDDRQHALRDVVAHCIYAVDKNPMAVELCKVALWIEAIDPGKPLSFLDAHIQCGDSLVGVFDPKVLEEGIPDGAFKPLAGDEASACKKLKSANTSAKRTFKGKSGGVQRTLELTPASPEGKHAEELEKILAIPEDSIANLAKKEDAYRQWDREKNNSPEKLKSDLFTAAFFIRKTGLTQDKVPDTADLADLEFGIPLKNAKISAVSEAAGRARFFHWQLSFPEIFMQGGFDCVLGNPPWETMSPDIKEWFSTYDPGIRNNSPDGQREIKETLLKNPTIKKSWEEDCNHLYSSASFIKSSGRYKFFAPGNLGKGDFNTYRFFTELSINLCSDRGIVGMIVPENLYNGANAMALRKVLTESRGPLLLRGFENSKKYWFSDIDSRAKFCLFVSPHSPAGEYSIDAEFCIRTGQRLRESRNRVKIPPWINKEIGGEALAIPEIRSNLEINILEKIYEAYPPFCEGYAAISDQRPYAAELHTGNERETYTNDINNIPLFEGKMVNQYDYRAKQYVSGRGRSAVWQDLEFETESKGIYPQWHIDPNMLDERRLRRINHFRISFCNVTSPTNQRSLIAALVPKGIICGDPVPTILLSKNSISSHFLWLAVANSIAMDFVARKKVGLHMTYPILDSLPIPVKNPESEAEKLITRLSASLSLAGHEMKELISLFKSEDYGWNGTILEDNLHRDRAKAEIDAIYASMILGLSREQIEFILDPHEFSEEFEDYETFGALKRAEIRSFGEYRTQRLILEAWDRLLGS